MLFADWSYCVDRNNDKVFLTVLIKSLCIKKMSNLIMKIRIPL